MSWGEIAIKVGGLLAYSAFEYWIGKTDKVKANSLIDLIVQFLVKLKKA